jgi:hypothetical protein
VGGRRRRKTEVPKPGDEVIHTEVKKQNKCLNRRQVSEEMLTKRQLFI